MIWRQYPQNQTSTQRNEDRIINGRHKLNETKTVPPEPDISPKKWRYGYKWQTPTQRYEHMYRISKSRHHQPNGTNTGTGFPERYKTNGMNTCTGFPKADIKPMGTNTGTGFPKADIKPMVRTRVQDSQKQTSNQRYEHGYRIPRSRYQTDGLKTYTGFPEADIKPTVWTHIQDSQKQISCQTNGTNTCTGFPKADMKPTVRTYVQDSQKQTSTNGTNTGTGFPEAYVKSKAWKPDSLWQAFTQRYGDRFPVADKHVRQQNGYGSHWRPCAISVLIASDHLSCRRETMFLKPSFSRSSHSDSISESVVTRFPAFCSCSVSGNSNKPTLFINTTTGSYAASVPRKWNVYMRSDLSCIYVA